MLTNMDSGVRGEVSDGSAESRAFGLLIYKPVIICHVSKRDEAALIQNSVQVQWTTSVFLSGPLIFIVPFSLSVSNYQFGLEPKEKHFSLFSFFFLLRKERSKKKLLELFRFYNGACFFFFCFCDYRFQFLSFHFRLRA